MRSLSLNTSFALAMSSGKFGFGFDQISFGNEVVCAIHHPPLVHLCAIPLDFPSIDKNNRRKQSGESKYTIDLWERGKTLFSWNSCYFKLSISLQCRASVIYMLTLTIRIVRECTIQMEMFINPTHLRASYLKDIPGLLLRSFSTYRSYESCTEVEGNRCYICVKSS